MYPRYGKRRPYKRTKVIHKRNCTIIIKPKRRSSGYRR